MELAAYIFYPEDLGSRFFRNVGKGLPGYTTSHLRRQHYSVYHQLYDDELCI